jgi:tRNA A37 threonylcarbamoyladenosine dehydratase
MEDRLERTRLLIGETAIRRLAESTVLVAGIGGVGSYAVEALARAGVGHLVLVDADVVMPSNINRQLIATTNTIGMPKVEAARERIAGINPTCQVSVHRLFLDTATIPIVVTKQVDFVIDAIDLVSSKISLASHCVSLGIKIISSMGTGNKLDPLRFRIVDVSKTNMCPLAKAYRVGLRRLGIRSGVPVVVSDEAPIKTGARVPGSVSFVPPVSGLAMAGFVIRALVDGHAHRSQES